MTEESELSAAKEAKESGPNCGKIPKRKINHWPVVRGNYHDLSATVRPRQFRFNLPFRCDPTRTHRRSYLPGLWVVFNSSPRHRRIKPRRFPRPFCSLEKSPLQNDIDSSGRRMEGKSLDSPAPP
jgi:hypothetical protein